MLARLFDSLTTRLAELAQRGSDSAEGFARRVRDRLPRRTRTVATLGYRTLRGCLGDRVLSLAAEVGFWAMLSLPPLLLALLGITGYVLDPASPESVERIQSWIVNVTGQVLTPEAVRTLVQPLIEQVDRRGYGGIASFGFILSLWSGSAAMGAYVRNITHAYDMPHLRSAWKSRLLAFLLYVCALVVVVVLLPVLVLGPDLISNLAPDDAAGVAMADSLRWFYWPVVGGVSILALGSLYHLSVPVRSPWHRDLPGAGLAMLLWVAGSYGLRFYLETTSKYGALAAPIGILLFFYVTALAVLIGAELNAEIDKMWPTIATLEGRQRTAE